MLWQRTTYWVGKTEDSSIQNALNAVDPVVADYIRGLIEKEEKDLDV